MEYPVGDLDAPLVNRPGWGAVLAHRVHGGATSKDLGMEDGEGTLLADSGRGLGWEVGGALIRDVNPRWSVSPGMRYRAPNRDVEIDGTTTGVDLTYTALHLGMGPRF